MRVRFNVRHSLRPKEPSLAAGRIYGMFGLETEQGERVYVEPFDLDLEPGQIVAFVGASGAGKTSCIRQFIEQTKATPLDRLLVPNVPVIDQLMDGRDDFDEVLGVASQCGMAEAQLLLRDVSELSDGQRYRFQMALSVLRGGTILAADEFLASLDRVSAKVIAFNIRKMVSRRGLTLAVASTQDDYLEDLDPDYVVRFDGRKASVEVRGRPKVRGVSRSTPICTLGAALGTTGTASLDGTTEATTSV